MSFPYFDTLLDHLRRGDRLTEEAWGRHVHWGHWDDPAVRVQTAQEFCQAAEAMLERMVARAAIADGASVLDAGCGIGGTLDFLRRRYSSCSLTGLNIDLAQIAVARDTQHLSISHNAAFVQADACALPFAAESFDAILCVESIFHFASRQKFMAECGRALKPGGRLVISDFVPLAGVGKWLDRAERATRLVGSMYGKFHADISIARYRVLARDAGLECTAIDDVTANTFPTYRFLKDDLRRTAKRGTYTLATSLLELVSKMRLVRYLILVFRRPS